MAQSPSHQFGQIIGDVLESAIRPVLAKVALELGFYLDRKGVRAVRGSKRKVSWVDGQGNAHDLDYVFEAGGTEEQIGAPHAFIETAWRRYTKHSRNKAQEIQGAILPLAERYSSCRPFLGVVLGGVFTTGSLNQLRSHGFAVLFFPYESIIAAFASVGIDATFDESTSDASLLKRVRQFRKLTAQKRELIAVTLREQHRAEVSVFTEAIRAALTRKLESVYILPLHGLPRRLKDITEAIEFIEAFDESTPDSPFTRYEVGVRYSNGDEIRGQFADKAAAIAFLWGVR